MCEPFYDTLHGINNEFEVGEEAIDRVSGRRSIETTTEPDQRVPEFRSDGLLSLFTVTTARLRAVDAVLTESNPYQFLPGP